MTRTEPPDGLLIRARQAHDDVAADPDRFRPAVDGLVAEARLARQPEALALALRAMARAERARRDDRRAIRLLDEACTIARRHHLDDALADLLMSHAAVSQELGRVTTARRDLQAAAGLVTGPRASELDFQRAVLLQNGGQLAEAAVLYGRVLPDPAATAQRKVMAANNLAMIETYQGRYGSALRRLSQAMPAAAKIGPAFVASVTQSRAWVTVRAGRITEGLRVFEEAEQAHRNAALPLGEYYIEYADALMELRLLPEAASAARRAVSEFSAAGIPLMEAEAQLRVAQLALLAGDAAEAITASATAAAAFRQQARPGWRARALLVTAEGRLQSGTGTPAVTREARAAARQLQALGVTSAAVQGFLVAGQLAAAADQRRPAIAALTQAATLARGASVLVRLPGRVSAALAARLRHRDAEALTHCRRGLRDLAQHRDRLPSLELRALASGHGAELGLIGLDIVVREGVPARVLNWMERSRAAGLLAAEPPQFAEIRAEITALRAVHGGGRDHGPQASRPAALARPRADQPEAEQAALEYRIRQTAWRATSVAAAPGAPVTVGALQDRLAGKVLVSYGVLGDNLVAVVIDRRRRRIVALGPLGPVREQVHALLFALRRLVQPRPPAVLAAARASADVRLRRLTGLLLQPLDVSDDAELVVVAVAGLHGVPWSALHRGPVSLAPSATSWAHSAAAAQGRTFPAGRVALVAGPGLPGAVAEVERLAGIYPAAIRLTPPDSTAEMVAQAMAGADLAHLACHGTLRADNPMFSALQLSDGPMTVQELYARGVAPYRLVLASCESGTQTGYAGDEVLGFVSALLARGTAGILASTAAVPDVEAVSLMTAVHRRLAGGATLAHALHEAWTSEDTDDPGRYVSWCTFAVHGAA
jgi:tetratricopeptide (TPR) repeat protein